MTSRRPLQIVLIVIYVLIAIVPAVVFFQERGGIGTVLGGTVEDDVRQIFPLFGLYALFLLWAQILLGSLMPWFSRVFPNIFFFHRGEGVVAFLFAVTHPALLTLAVGLKAVISKSFVSPEQAVFVTLGQLALILLTVTVGTAFFMRLSIFRRVWRKIHVLNYAVFVLAWLHSWNIGSDVRFTGLKWLWLFYGVTAAGALLLRLTRVRRQPRLAGRRTMPSTQPTSAPTRSKPTSQP